MAPDEQWWTEPAPQVVPGETDTQGRHTLRVHFARVDPPRPHTVSAQATVLDVNRQPWTTTQTLLVHPATVYAGLRTERGWIRSGEPIDLSVVAVDLDGKPVVGSPVRVMATRLEWKPDDARASRSVASSASRKRCATHAASTGSRALGSISFSVSGCS